LILRNGLLRQIPKDAVDFIGREESTRNEHLLQFTHLITLASFLQERTHQQPFLRKNSVNVRQEQQLLGLACNRKTFPLDGQLSLGQRSDAPCTWCVFLTHELAALLKRKNRSKELVVIHTVRAAFVKAKVAEQALCTLDVLHRTFRSDDRKFQCSFLLLYGGEQIRGRCFCEGITRFF